MDLIENIKTRRSIRTYTKQNIEKSQILLLLESAMYAPSAHNEQPWQFIVVDDTSILEKISWFHQWITMAKEAPVGILVCWDLNKDVAGGFWIQDCAAATQNILLTAHNLWLGTVWTGIYPQKDIIEKFSSFFKLPEHIVPFAFIPLGYPAGEWRAGNRFKEEKIHWNSR